MIAEVTAVAAVLKTLTDLAGELDNSIKDNKTRDLFLPVKEKVIQVQQAFLEFQVHNLDLKRRHLDEIDQITSRHRDAVDKLVAEKRQLQTKVDQLESQPKATASPKTGTLIDDLGNHYCPHCKLQDKWSPMRTEKHGWQCEACDKFVENPDNPAPRSLGPDNPRTSW